MKRFKTKYPGVYYREAARIGGRGTEKVYYAVWKKDGKTHEEKIGRQYADQMTPAKAARIRSEIIEGRRETRKAIRQKRKEKKWTINALWDKYCQTFPNNKGLPNEKRKFDKYLRKSIGKKEPILLAPLDVDRLRLQLQRAGKLTTAARVLELLRRSANFGVKRGLVTPLPFKIEIPRLNNQRTEDLTPKQLKELLKALDNDKDQMTANVMRLALFTGMRRGEIFKLKWTDIDTENGFITLRDPKGGPDQKIPLSSMARDVLNSIEPVPKNPHVFPGRFKEGSIAVLPRKSLDRIKKAARLPKQFRPMHGLRHAFASMLANSGKVDLYTLQKLLTHKSPLMTQRYAHLRDEALKKASDVAANMIEQVSAADEDEKDNVVNLDNK